MALRGDRIQLASLPAWSAYCDLSWVKRHLDDVALALVALARNTSDGVLVVLLGPGSHLLLVLLGHGLGGGLSCG